ncbi:MAG: hypothetical protein Q4D51_02345 [Eubacteriales bacterium]|nr:hypothetical protein [Eubacteriales bacterium]
MLDVLKIVLPVVLMLGIGSICRVYQIFDRAGIDAMKKFVVNIALSAVLVNAFASMEYSFMTLFQTLCMFAVCVVSWFVGKIVSHVMRGSNFIPFLVSGFEAGMLGYAFYSMLYGTEHLSVFAKLDLGQVLFVFTFYKIMLGKEEAKQRSNQNLLLEMIKSPTIIAISCGVMIGLTGLYHIANVKQVLDACTNFISAPTSAVILLTIGYDLVFGKIPWKAVGQALISRIIIMVVLRVGLGVLFTQIGLSDETLQALNVMLILPPPFVISVFAKDEKQQTYLSSVLTLSTVISLIGFMVLAILLLV